MYSIYYLNTKWNSEFYFIFAASGQIYLRLEFLCLLLMKHIAYQSGAMISGHWWLIVVLLLLNLVLIVLVSENGKHLIGKTCSNVTRMHKAKQGGMGGVCTWSCLCFKIVMAHLSRAHCANFSIFFMNGALRERY